LQTWFRGYGSCRELFSRCALGERNVYWKNRLQNCVHLPLGNNQRYALHAAYWCANVETLSGLMDACSEIFCGLGTNMVARETIFLQSISCSTETWNPLAGWTESGSCISHPKQFNVILWSLINPANAYQSIEGTKMMMPVIFCLSRSWHQHWIIKFLTIFNLQFCLIGFSISIAP